MTIAQRIHTTRSTTTSRHGSGWVRRIGIAATGLALASTTVVVGARTPNSGDAATIQPAIPESSSALLDAERFAAVVDQAVAGIDTGRSALLDEDEFAAAVKEAVAGR